MCAEERGERGGGYLVPLAAFLDSGKKTAGASRAKSPPVEPNRGLGGGRERRGKERRGGEGDGSFLTPRFKRHEHCGIVGDEAWREAGM